MQMKQETRRGEWRKGDIRDTAVTGLLIAMVFLATKFINVRLPVSINGGLIHMGNVMLFTAALLFGKRKGAMAGAFGMGLFDVVSGWLAWAPFTFLIRGGMGYIIGAIAHSRGEDGKNAGLNLLGVAAASVWMLAGYYGTEGILYGNWVAPLTSIPGNVTQLVIGAVVGLPLAAVLKRTPGAGNYLYR